MMGSLADATVQNGGEVFGVITEALSTGVLWLIDARRAGSVH
jgi:hypothetical protein